ncbi:hypothetical protein [Bacillus sp. FJAT-45350]|nr:hypothetical protein [Bacillus sp. FJAT-45350]
MRRKRLKGEDLTIKVQWEKPTKESEQQWKHFVQWLMSNANKR